MLGYLKRRLTSPERWISCLLVVQSHVGEEVFRVGGCWDTHLQCYVERPCAPHVVHLEESQLEAGIAFATWLEKQRAKKKRRRALVLGGNRGSGKTFEGGGIFIVAMALEFPGDVGLAVNLTSAQRRECLDAIEQVCSPADEVLGRSAQSPWITAQPEDADREAKTIFVTGFYVEWLSAKNPKKLRSAGRSIRYVFINEGQDQPQKVYTNAIAAIRNTGGLVCIATNPPTSAAGNWIARLWAAILAGDVNAEAFLLENKKNRSVDQDALEDIGPLIRCVSPEDFTADVEGTFQLAGNIAYPAFKPMRFDRGGHLTMPLAEWVDVTADFTGPVLESQAKGPEWICGVDFQRTPGIIGSIGKLYRRPDGVLVLWIMRTIAVRGVEADFSQALYSAGFTPSSILLVGDGTGARQNAEHKFAQSNSFAKMKEDGWHIVPPMYHWRRRTPWNPAVKDSRSQMHTLLSSFVILFGEECKLGGDGFPSLVESFASAQCGPRGGLLEAGHYQHGPDGVRYLAWRFLPRPKIVAPSEEKVDLALFRALS